jgi:hypothetical protein
VRAVEPDARDVSVALELDVVLDGHRSSKLN